MSTKITKQKCWQKRLWNIHMYMKLYMWWNQFTTAGSLVFMIICETQPRWRPWGVQHDWYSRGHISWGHGGCGPLCKIGIHGKYYSCNSFLCFIVCVRNLLGQKSSKIILSENILSETFLSGIICTYSSIKILCFTLNITLIQCKNNTIQVHQSVNPSKMLYKNYYNILREFIFTVEEIWYNVAGILISRLG